MSELNYNLLQQPNIDLVGNYARGRDLAEQSDMRRMQIQQQQQNINDKNTLRDLLKQSGGDPVKFYQAAAQVDPAYLGKAHEIQQQQKKEKIDVVKDALKIVYMGGGNDAAMQSAAQQMLKSGIYTPEEVQAQSAKLMGMTPADRVNYAQSNLVNVDKYFEVTSKQNDPKYSENLKHLQLGNKKIQQELQSGGKPTFSSEQGGYVYPPDQQNQQGRFVPVPGINPKSQSKPMPPAALKMQNESIDAIGALSSLNADLKAIDSNIENGKLNLGAYSNLANRARNMAGISTEESRNLATFQATLERLRNESLRLNKGVQTEGDSIRAWNEILANINDQKLVRQRLGEVMRINERAAQLRELEMGNIRANYGYDPLNVERQKSVHSSIHTGGGSNIDSLLDKYK